MEIWKDIVGYEGLYQVSNIGRVRSLPRNSTKGKILKPRLQHDYYTVHLSKNGKTINKLIHRAVAESFLTNNYNLPEVNHIDGDKLNNRLDNLEWCSTSYNAIHAFKLGLRTPNITMLGKPSPRRKKLKCLDTDIVYESVTMASKLTGINRGHIADCCRKERKTAGGCRWVYIE